MNLISEDYLMHHGVKGMKWGVRKRQETYRRAAEQAKRFSGYASESHNNYKYLNDAKKSGTTIRKPKKEGPNWVPSKVSKEDTSRWMRISSKQKKAYDELYKKYSSTPVNKITRKDYKAAKRFLKQNFVDAEYSDVYGGSKVRNYQENYDFENGKIIFKKK